MVDRMMRAVRADVSLYEEVERTPALQQEAYTVVGIVAAVSALISLVFSMLFGQTDIVGALVGAVVTVIFTFIGYFIWSFAIYFIGTRLFQGQADYPEMRRTLAYSYTPNILGGIPILGLVAGLWAAYLAFVAIRQGLDLDNTKALITAVVSWLVLAAISFGIGLIVAALGFGVAAIAS